jgi:hypothetical protein
MQLFNSKWNKKQEIDQCKIVIEGDKIMIRQ